MTFRKKEMGTSGNNSEGTFAELIASADSASQSGYSGA
jgi:hypothetical protein